MRLPILTVLLVFTSMTAFSQSQINNNSLEFWVSDTINFLEGYYTSSADTSSIYANSCTPSTDSYTGNYSLRLETIIQGQDTAVGHITNSLSTSVGLTPFSFAADSVHGYYKSNIVGSDTGLITVNLFQNGFDIGASTYSFSASTNTSTWTKFSFPINILPNAIPQAILFKAYSSNPKNPALAENGSWVMLDSVYFNKNNGTSDTLNNFDFERWVQKPIEQLEEFSTNILKDPSVSPSLVEKVSDATDGLFAAKINTSMNNLGLTLRGVLTTGQFEQKGIIWQGGSPFTSEPDFLTFDYKFDYITPDLAIVVVQFTKNGQLVSSGLVSAPIYASTNDYESDTINLTFTDTPDTLVLMAIGGDYPGTSLTVDNFVFHYLVGITETGSIFQVKSFPNPTTEKLNFVIQSKKFVTGLILINDISGKILEQKTLNFNEGFNQFSVDVSTLNSGNYIYTIQIGDTVISKTFIKD